MENAAKERIRPPDYEYPGDTLARAQLSQMRELK
jgi:hypothetical protein